MKWDAIEIFAACFIVAFILFLVWLFDFLQRPVQPMTKCIIPNCNYQQAASLKTGLCLKCHGKAKAKVEAGVVSWEELIGLGLALPSDETDPFEVELKKKLEGN